MKYTNMYWGWKAVEIGLTTRNGFQYWLGKWAKAKLPEGEEFTTCEPGPSFDGDGICIATTFAGAASSMRPAAVAIYCGYYSKDVLGGCYGKVRVKKLYVYPQVFDVAKMLREGMGKYCNFAFANFSGMDLNGSDLRGAKLTWANLCKTNMQRTYLTKTVQ